MNSNAILEKISKGSLYVLAFLLPLWFLPFTQDILNFQKQTLLIVFVLLSLVAWFARVVSKGEFALSLNWLHVPVLVLILSVALSSFFSLWRYGSFWGWPLNVSDSFLTIIALTIMYFLIVNSAQGEEGLFHFFLVSILSTVLAGIYTILQLYQIFLIPLQFTKNATFNTVGSTNSVAVLAASFLPLTLAMAFASKVLLRWILWILAVLLLAIVLLINAFISWIVLGAGLLVLLAFGMWNLKKRAAFGWISFPMALLFVAVFFMIFRVALPGAPVSPLEVSPSRSAQIGMLQQVFSQGPRALLFGTGPGTFIFDYAKYHPAVLNQTIFWGTRFTSGAAEVLDWLITKGVLGGGAFIIVLLLALFLGIRALVNSKGDATASWMVGLGVLASFVAIGVGQAVYSSNLTLSFLSWVLLGGVGVMTTSFQKKISIAPPSFLAVISSFLFLLVLIFGVGLLFLGGQKYAAEMQYYRGAQAFSQGNFQGGLSKIVAAARLNPAVDLYWRDLAQLYLVQVNQISQDATLSADQKTQQTQTAVSNATLAANQAITANPANIENWNVRGFIYRNLVGAQGADTFAIASYQNAVTLEPASPFSWTELGRVYFLQAQSLATQKNTEDQQKAALQKALENLNKAVSLKADYAPANYLIALVYDQQGKSEDAIKKLEETQILAPNDIGLAFQLGVIYYQKNSLDKAQSEFEKAKTINPNYANARYMLGLVYDKQKQKDKAIEEFKKVAELNPDNEQIKKILANLATGKSALSGIQVSQPPIQENPPEINSNTTKPK